MKRRDSLKAMAVLLAGSSMLTSCEPKNIIWEEGMNSIKLNSTSSNFINQLSQIILPTDGFEYTPPEPFTRFLETIINDGKSTEDIAKFGQGFNDYVTYITEQFNKPINELNEEEVETLFAAVGNEEAMSESAQVFFADLRGLSLWHVKSSQEYLENHTNYEMVPARFNGCYPMS